MADAHMNAGLQGTEVDATLLTPLFRQADVKQAYKFGF